MQLPKRIYLICWKRALLEKEDTKSWKMCLSKPKSSNITMAKTYFWTLTVAQSCLTSLTVSLWLCATQLQWLQIFICFLVCSHSPLCPTWLSACLTKRDGKSPAFTFTQELLDGQETHPKANRKLRRALSTSPVGGIHCFSALPHLSAAVSLARRTCDLCGEGGWAKILSHMWHWKEKRVEQGWRRERLTGMRIFAKATFDIETGNNLEKREPWVHVWAIWNGFWGGNWFILKIIGCLGEFWDRTELVGGK